MLSFVVVGRFAAARVAASGALTRSAVGAASAHRATTRDATVAGAATDSMSLPSDGTDRPELTTGDDPDAKPVGVTDQCLHLRRRREVAIGLGMSRLWMLRLSQPVIQAGLPHLRRARYRISLIHRVSALRIT